MLEDLLHYSALFDLYGALLTDKQRRCLVMHLFEDYSLSEIGEAFSISRQAVHDMLRRSEQTMEAYEDRLGLLARHDAEREKLERIYDGLRALDARDEEAKDALLTALAPLAGREDRR